MGSALLNVIYRTSHILLLAMPFHCYHCQMGLGFKTFFFFFYTRSRNYTFFIMQTALPGFLAIVYEMIKIDNGVLS